MIDILLTTFCAVFALFVLLSSNPIVSAFSLLTLFVGMAGIFFHLGSSFLAIIQVLVYAGAIAILFVFVLMLLNVDFLNRKSFKKHFRPIFGILCLAVIFGIFAIIVRNNSEVISIDKLPTTNMGDLFSRLFDYYLVPFELATIMLFAAVISVITMTKKYFSTPDGKIK